jgi:hypothetical protein
VFGGSSTKSIFALPIPKMHIQKRGTKRPKPVDDDISPAVAAPRPQTASSVSVAKTSTTANTSSLLGSLPNPQISQPPVAAMSAVAEPRFAPAPQPQSQQVAIPEPPAPNQHYNQAYSAADMYNMSADQQYWPQEYHQMYSQYYGANVAAQPAASTQSDSDDAVRISMASFHVPFATCISCFNYCSCNPVNASHGDGSTSRFNSIYGSQTT